MMVKKYNIFFNLLLAQVLVVLCFSSFNTHKDDPKRKVRTIVIDPGHGGKDPGCNGVSCKEKEVSLAVALKLGKLIEEHIKDVKVIFTRKTDVFVELEDRARIANDNNADLFISIHCNAAGKPVMIKDKKTGKMRPKTFKNSKGKTIVVETANPEPFGSETYVMGLKNEEGKMKVAQRENSAMLLEDNYETKYQGFDPNSEESYIIMSNYTSSYVIQSASLALKIQDQYLNKAGRVDKGVHRQSIWVLWRTSMPSVLTEIGYLTNPQEEKFLGSEKGQTYIAACLFRAFRKYKDEQEGVKKTYDDAIENQVPLAKETYTVSKVSTEEKVEVEKEEAVDAGSKKEDEAKSDEDEKEKTIIAEAKKNKLASDNIALVDAMKKAKADSIANAKALQDKLIAEKKAKTLAEQKAKDDAIELAKADSTLAVKEQQSKINEQENKYKQLLAVADMNFKNKNYQDALSIYQKAEVLNVKDKSSASQKIKEIDAILKKADADKATKERVDAEKLTKETITHSEKEKKEESPKQTNPTNGISFKVQFASIDKEVDAKVKFANVSEVSFYKAGAIFKYTSGNFSSFDDATKQQAKLKELGYKIVL